jgi:ion channel-forming bestrophin family protein
MPLSTRRHSCSIFVSLAAPDLLQPASCESDNNSVRGFWRDAFEIHGSITPHIMPNVLLMGAIASVICVFESLVSELFHTHLAVEVAPYELTGAALGLLLVLRTNSGYERWWEARKLWGGIVNQSRNLAIIGLSYGPKNDQWRQKFVSLICLFSYACRTSLRGQKQIPESERLAGILETEQLEKANHLPTAVALRLSHMLREASENHSMDSFSFLQAQRELVTLIDHIGGCERILKTPLAHAYSIKIRRFIAIFLLTLPFALMYSLDQVWLVPIVTMLVAYPLFSLDQLGVELQNPFSTDNLSHLPLDEICGTIESNLMDSVNSSIAQYQQPTFAHS